MTKLYIKKLKNLGGLFLATVAVPTVLSIFYFGLIASDIYVSESRFVVRSPEKQTSGGLGMLLKSAGFSSAGDEIYAVQDYAVSRDALRALNSKGEIAAAYSAEQVDFINRWGFLPFSRNFESLYKYYESMIKVQHDTVSSVTTLTVRAYTAKEAHAVNEQILRLSEALVNTLNRRGQHDLVGYAQREVDNSERQAQAAAFALSIYRNQEAIVDPEKQAQVQLQLISKLQDELIASRGQLSQLRKFTPENPQIETLQQHVASLEKEIQRETSNVAGSQQSLAGKTARYQRLLLESQFADRQLASAMASLQDARNEARRKQVYLERIVQPNQPDTAIEPRRLRNIFATFVLGMVAWGILTMLLAGLREHQD